jgi:hypothetical protein
LQRRRRRAVHGRGRWLGILILASSENGRGNAAASERGGAEMATRRSRRGLNEAVIHSMPF